MTMIRYHSFYPWHSGGAYKEITNAQDDQYKQWILDFNTYDLYTKSNTLYDLDELKAYYMPIALKYLGEGRISF